MFNKNVLAKRKEEDFFIYGTYRRAIKSLIKRY